MRDASEEHGQRVSSRASNAASRQKNQLGCCLNLLSPPWLTTSAILFPVLTRRAAFKELASQPVIEQRRLKFPWRILSVAVHTTACPTPNDFRHLAHGHLAHEQQGKCLKPAINYFPVQTRSQQFMKHAFRRHAQTLPTHSTKNSEEPKKLHQVVVCQRVATNI